MDSVDKIVSSILQEDDKPKKYNVLFTPRRVADRAERELNRILNILKREEYVGDLDLSDVESLIPDIYDITDLGNLRVIHGNVELGGSKIASLGNLERVDGDLSLSHTDVSDLGKLEYVGGSLFIYSTNVKSLGNLKYVGGYLNANRTRLVTLDPLEEVNGALDLVYCPDLVSLGSLKRVGGFLEIGDDLFLSDLGSLKYAGGVRITNAIKLKTLDPLEEVSGDLDILHSNIVSLGSLRVVGGSVRASYSKLADLGSLEYVGGDLEANHSNLETLGNLKNVRGSLDLTGCSNLISFGLLRKVGRDLYLDGTKVTDLPVYIEVGRRVYISRDSEIDTGKLDSRIKVIRK